MKKSILLSVALLTSAIIFSQKRTKDTIDTEEITVLRPYSPSVSDAFKIKVNPKITDSITKETVAYSIFSVPVASTFTPAKGRAKVLRVDPSAPVYDNFITGGYGNFNSPQAELFFKTNSNDYNEFGGFINYHASVGGVKDAILDDQFLDTRVDLFYKQEERDFDWQINGGFRYQKYNWYGLSDAIDYSQTIVDSINEDLNYTDVYLGGMVDYSDSFFQGATAELYRFTDDEGSSEFYVLAKPKIEFPIATELINAEARVEFLTGDFFQNFEATDAISYTFLNAGFNPNFEVLRDNLTINLGVDLVYSAASGVAESKGYVYPKVTASYILIDQVLTLYAGVTGGLHQNSFREFTNVNPFVSPTLNIQRTDQQYNAYAGLKGKLASNVSYNFKGGYKNERDKALFKLNASRTDGVLNVAKGYEAANSFQVVYDEVSTLFGFAEVSVDFSKSLKFGGSVEYNNFSTTNEQEAWNLPTLRATAFANFNRDQWFAGAHLFFIGERNDELTFSIPGVLINRSSEIIEVGNYVDLNLNGGYKFTDKLTAFAKVNNVFGSNYQKYTNFNVQGLQVFAGLTYKFDF